MTELMSFISVIKKNCSVWKNNQKNKLNAGLPKHFFAWYDLNHIK